MACERRGFSLLELLVAMVILLAIVTLLFSLTRTVGSAWTNTTGKAESFRNARVAFEAMTRSLRQATLNSAYDYVDRDGHFRGSGMTNASVDTAFVPYSYAPQSDLHFICGQGATLLAGATNAPVTHAIFFQAPLGVATNTSGAGLEKLLNACGFYVVYGPDPSRPAFLASLPARYRYRLMQFLQPTEAMNVYRTSTAGGNPNAWFTASITPSPAPESNFVLAENVIALVIWPKFAAGDQTSTNSLTADYSYDSRRSGPFDATRSRFLPTFNQLPPVVQVTMVAIDEASAVRLGNPAQPPNAQLGLSPGLFRTATYPTAGQEDQLQQDLHTLEQALIASRVNYRIFQTEIPLPGANGDK